MQTITEIFLLCFKEVKEKEEERKRKEKYKKKKRKNEGEKEKERTGNKILVREKKKILVKKDQCNKSHSLIPLHSN